MTQVVSQRTRGAYGKQGRQPTTATNRFRHPNQRKTEDRQLKNKAAGEAITVK